MYSGKFLPIFFRNFGKEALIFENIFLKFSINLKEQYSFNRGFVVSMSCQWFLHVILILLSQVYAWFLEISFVQEVGMCMHTHVSVPQAIKNNLRKNKAIKQLLLFSFFMILAINTIDGWALVTTHVVNSCQEEKGNAVFAVH